MADLLTPVASAQVDKKAKDGKMVGPASVLGLALFFACWLGYSGGAEVYGVVLTLGVALVLLGMLLPEEEKVVAGKK